MMLSRLSTLARFAKPLGARSITHVHRPGEGQTKRVTLIPGMGIGPDLTTSVQRVFEAANCPIEWDVIDNFSFEKAQCRELLKMNPTIMLGVVKSLKNESKYIANYPLYKYLDLYANVVHAYSIPGVDMRHKKVDVVIIRENTEGEYSGVEHEVYPGVAASLKIMTKTALMRISEYAFEFAYMTGRKKVTAVHKANIMKLADGLFLQCAREVAKKYPFIKYEEMIIDNCAMQLVKNPWQFDVMVLPNLYGSLVQNIAAGITGGCGLTAGSCVGKNYQLFSQGSRHTGHDIIGKNKANPTAILFSSVLMLRSLGLPRFAELIDQSITKTLSEKQVRTPDIGGHNSTTEYVDEVIKNLRDIQANSRC